MAGFFKFFESCQMKFSKESKQEGFEGWSLCKSCKQMIYDKDVEENFYCCPCCDYHLFMPASKRIELLCEKGSYQELFAELSPTDPLNFTDTESYENRLKKAQKKTGLKDAFHAGIAKIFNQEIALGVMDFSFMGGSMGSVVGEKITRLVEYALSKRLPVVLVCASGGARMQESCLSLMQMAKTAAAFARLEESQLPYISILTHPTTGGVTASFATIADIIIAEPLALIAFAGPRVVEQTIGQKLPKNAQKAEFLLENGMVDLVCHRKNLKEKIFFFLKMFLKSDKTDQAEKKKEDEKSSSSDKIESFLKIATKQQEQSQDHKSMARD